MAQAQRFKQVMSVIERRILRGDYLLRPFPSERKIAEETGVSHMTARKALRGLVEKSVLIRQTNGTLGIAPSVHTETGAAQIVLLYPAFPSVYLSQLRQTVFAAAEEYGAALRPVQYVHWDDPVVMTAVSNRGGAIIIPSSLDVPDYILTAIRANRVVSLDADLSDRDVPSIRLFSDSHICSVFKHLQKLGHTRIDCISSHVHNPIIEHRIQLWRDWSARHHTQGELWEKAAPSFSDPTPFAYDAMRRLLARGPLQATAFVATTFPAAVGAMRACRDHGLVVGQDVSICSINIESPARYMTPSVTGLDTPDFTRLLRQCYEWFNSDQPWTGPKLLEPARSQLFKGESTGLARSEVPSVASAT